MTHDQHVIEQLLKNRNRKVARTAKEIIEYIRSNRIKPVVPQNPIYPSEPEYKEEGWLNHGRMITVQ